MKCSGRRLLAASLEGWRAPLVVKTKTPPGFRERRFYFAVRRALTMNLADNSVRPSVANACRASTNYRPSAAIKTYFAVPLCSR